MRKSSSPRGDSFNKALPCVAISSCLSRSLFHSLLRCEPKFQGQELLGSCGSGGRMFWQKSLCHLWEGRSNTGIPTFETLDISLGKSRWSGKWLSGPLNTLSLSTKEVYSRDSILCPQFPHPRGASSPLVGLALHLDHWSDFRSNWAMLSISFMSWQGYHVIT